MNFLPFGYEKTFTLDVGSLNDTREELRVDEKTMGERQTTERGSFRKIENQGTVIFHPRAVLREATLNLELKGEGLYFIKQPDLDIDWDYDFDFTEFKLEGTDSLKYDEDGCVIFDGETRLVYPDSKDKFEKGPFAVYVEWIPKKREGRQQLIGRYNWEFYQHKEMVRLSLSTKTHKSYSITSSNTENLLHQKNNALILYNLSYVALFVNGKLIEKVNTDSEGLRENYARDLSMGHTRHMGGDRPLFEGSICQAKFAYKELKPERKDSLGFTVDTRKEMKISIFGTGLLEEINAEIIK